MRARRDLGAPPLHFSEKARTIKGLTSSSERGRQTRKRRKGGGCILGKTGLPLPNQACCSPCTSMARPKSASLTAAPLHLLASSKFSGCRRNKENLRRHPPWSPKGAYSGLTVPLPSTRWRQQVTSRRQRQSAWLSTFRSRWTMSCWWMWLTLSRI